MILLFFCPLADWLIFYFWSQKVQVIEEAIKYIDSLHVALFQRLRAQELATTSDADTVSSE